MIENLDDLDNNSRITKNHLRDMLKAEAKNIHMEGHYACIIIFKGRCQIHASIL
jgi:hypothetical protein